MFKKLGFFGKQVAVYTFLMTAAMVFVTLFAHSRIMEIGRENAVITQEQLAVSTVRQVDNYLEQLMLVATQVSHDSEIVETMAALYDEGNPRAENHFAVDLDAQTRMVDLLSNHNKHVDPFYRIDAFNIYGDYISTDSRPDVLSAGAAFTEAEWYRDFLNRVFGEEESRDFILLGPIAFFMPEDLKGQNYVYMEVPVESPDGSQIYGYVNVYQSLDELYAQLNTGKETATDVFLCYEVNNGDLGSAFYPTGSTLPETDPPGYHRTIQRSNYSIYIVLLQNQEEFLASYRDIRSYLFAGSFCLLVLLLLCVYLLVRRTSRPILELNRRVREATFESPFQPPSNKEALDEVRELTHSVDQMTQRLKISAELEKKAYLHALQAQMKPHFLYNCLATLSSMGVEVRSKEIPKFCNRLAAILRYESTYDDKPTTLANELENVENYLELMKLRYEEDFTYQLDVEEDLLDLPMPRLVLQPMVENCFDHGFRTMTPPWRISIQIFREGDRWCIRICDNGSGFDEEKQQELLRQVDSVMDNVGGNYAQLKIGGLGLVNTIVRLRLLTDDRLSYSITPNAPTGSIVTLKGVFHV